MTRIIGQPIERWERSGWDYVLLSRDEIETIGPIHLNGDLDEALEEARAGSRPLLKLTVLETEVQGWFVKWVWARPGPPILPTAGRKLTIRDNRRKRWVYLDGASVWESVAAVDSRGSMRFTIRADKLKEGEDEDGPLW